MAKQSSPFGNPAAPADWLPLVGAICQVVASISEAPSDEHRDETAAAQGPMYDDGQGVAQDCAEAVRWFRLAAVAEAQRQARELKPN